MGGLKPRAGSALAKCVPRTEGAALWAGATAATPGAVTMATEWQTWQLVQLPQSVAAVSLWPAGGDAGLWAAALPWQSACGIGGGIGRLNLHGHLRCRSDALRHGILRHHITHPAVDGQ